MFFVPYNDHGKWGYSDTLGNVVIKPSYLATTLFRKQASENGLIYSAVATTRAGEIMIDPSGESLIPNKTTVVYHNQFRTSPTSFRIIWVLQNKKGQTAIYSPGSDEKPDFEYDKIPESLYGPYGNYGQAPLLLKNRKTGKLEQLDPKDASLKPTDYTQLLRLATSRYKWSSKLYAINQAGDTLQYSRGKFTKAIFQEGKNYSPVIIEREPYKLEIDPPEFEDMAMDDNTIYLKPEERVALQQKFEVDTLLQAYSFSSYINQTYGFSRLYLARKAGKLGVINQIGKEVLSFTYDKILLRDNATQATLVRDKKYGRKLFLTHYPTIEPIYDDFTEYHRYRVNRRWSFQVYVAEVDGKYVLIGENGKRYYDLE